MTGIYIITAIILILIYMYVEAGWLKISRINFTKNSKGLKILHISDVHIDMLRIKADRIKEVVRNENPDLLLLTGDYIQTPIHASLFLDFLQRIKQNNKTFLCLGNHDYKAYKGNKEGLESFIKEIRSLQAEVLINASVVIEKNGVQYNLTGIDDLREGKPDIEKALENRSSSAAGIVFSHNPDLVLQLNRNQADYFFCGHFHGGQIWMPFNLEFVLLRKDELCKKDCKRGLHKINGINTYINRGLGNVVVPFRFFSRPEISIYTLP